MGDIGYCYIQLGVDQNGRPFFIALYLLILSAHFHNQINVNQHAYGFRHCKDH